MGTRESIEALLFFQVRGYLCKLRQRGLQILYNLTSDDVGWREVGAVFEAFVFEPEDVEVELIALG